MTLKRVYLKRSRSLLQLSAIQKFQKSLFHSYFLRNKKTFSHNFQKKIKKIKNKNQKKIKKNQKKSKKKKNQQNEQKKSTKKRNQKKEQKRLLMLSKAIILKQMIKIKKFLLKKQKNLL